MKSSGLHPLSMAGKQQTCLVRSSANYSNLLRQPCSAGTTWKMRSAFPWPCTVCGFAAGKVNIPSSSYTEAFFFLGDGVVTVSVFCLDQRIPSVLLLGVAVWGVVARWQTLGIFLIGYWGCQWGCSVALGGGGKKLAHVLKLYAIKL